jgi:hypothetical protein
MIWRRVCLAAFTLTFTAAAQESQGWERLRALTPGESLLIRQKDSRTWQGSFVKWSDNALTIRAGSTESNLARDTVARVESRRKTRRLRNALIGGAIGLAIGLTMNYTLGTRLRNEGQAEAAQAWLVLGPTLACAGIGAAIPSYPTVYRAPRR